jgi:hypothetical protein
MYGDVQVEEAELAHRKSDERLSVAGGLKIQSVSAG